MSTHNCRDKERIIQLLLLKMCDKVKRDTDMPTLVVLALPVEYDWMMWEGLSLSNSSRSSNNCHFLLPVKK